MLFSKLWLFALIFQIAMNLPRLFTTSIPKSNSREITYSDYKKLDSLKFNNELKNALTKESIDNDAKLIMKTMQSQHNLLYKINMLQVSFT